MNLKSLSDHALSRELDRLEKTGTVPGSEADKHGSSAIAAVKREFERRKRMDYAARG